MIETVYNSATVFVLNDLPDWSQSVELDVQLVSTQRRGLTGAGARQPLGESLRCSVSWMATLGLDPLNTLRASLRSLLDESVLCPAWPFATAGSDWTGTTVSGGLLIAWLEDWSDFEIGAAIGTPGDWDYVAPLLTGRLDAAPDIRPLTGASVEVEFHFVEDGTADLALSLSEAAWQAGPALADATTPAVFPFAADWSTRPKADAQLAEIERAQLGTSRQTAVVAYPQTPARPQTATVLLTSGSQVAELLRWFADARGAVAAHYVVGLVAQTHLSAAAAAGANTVNVNDAAFLTDNPFLAIESAAGVEVFKVTAIDELELTLSGNLAGGCRSNARVCQALLAAHARDSLKLTFSTPTLARVSLDWRELPPEYIPGAGETRGTTLGALALKAFLYEIQLDWEGATETHRFTGYERNLTAAGQVWTSRPVEHGELRQSLALDRDEVTLKTRWWAGSPFRQFLPNALDARVSVKIYECEVGE